MNPLSRKKITIILNRESGTLVKLGADKVEKELREILENLGCTVDIQSVTGKEAQAALEASLRGDADAVFVGGGDGTVASAANIFAGHNKPLGILPLGTLNLAARDVGMPLEWQEAAKTLVSAPTTNMDLMEVEGRYCLCMLILGFYPALVMGQPEYHGSWLVKAVRTFWDTLHSAMVYPPLNLRLTDAGQVQSHRTRLVLLANNDYEDVFGVLPVRKGLDAGYFTVYISKHKSTLGFLKSCLLWVMGRWKQDQEVTMIRATELEIDVKRKRRIAVMMDGELKKISMPFRVKLMPKLLCIIAPRMADEVKDGIVGNIFQLSTQAACPNIPDV